MKNSSAALGDDVLFSSTNVFCTMTANYLFTKVA